MKKAWLLAVLVLSGCSTITTEPPKDLSRFAEVDVVITDDTPEVTISNVAAYTGFSSRNFFTSLAQKEPTKLFLSPGIYLVQVDCYGTLSIKSKYGEPIWYTPEYKVSVDAGKKYWLGCKHTDSGSQVQLNGQKVQTQ